MKRLQRLQMSNKKIYEIMCLRTERNAADVFAHILNFIYLQFTCNYSDVSWIFISSLVIRFNILSNFFSCKLDFCSGE